jgi:hypothetical protein
MVTAAFIRGPYPLKSPMDAAGDAPASKTAQELLESGAESSWSNERRFFVAVTVDLNALFRGNGSAGDFCPN